MFLRDKSERSVAQAAMRGCNPSEGDLRISAAWSAAACRYASETALALHNLARASPADWMTSKSFDLEPLDKEVLETGGDGSQPTYALAGSYLQVAIEIRILSETPLESLQNGSGELLKQVFGALQHAQDLSRGCDYQAFLVV
eukprot:CAMPEP_0206492932 /NCGR_PEP_ID=MMETSP0324_2-20121206/46523_1 /ASSEMBLY_ACC=CAM_ASM_000836 /TAXON_ID=2866 /ORGANISM="Crypthecodinium cohnii, Strain Seligo" /LENGTH=142 /DNA_ID=CAMNT_0053975683 /DNA_START=147 /DNA_END=574 /DNA_ORIENTATION=-